MADLNIRFNVRVTPTALRWGAAGLILLGMVPELGSESVTLSTYYPAPSGIYTQMITTQNTFLARDGGNVGVGTTNPQSKLDINGDMAVNGLTRVGNLNMAEVDASDNPLGATGQIYYNQVTDQYRARYAGGWRELGGAASALKVSYVRSGTGNSAKQVFCPSDYPMILSCFTGDDYGWDHKTDTNPASRGYSTLGTNYIYTERVVADASTGRMGCIAYSTNNNRASFFIEALCAAIGSADVKESTP